VNAGNIKNNIVGNKNTMEKFFKHVRIRILKEEKYIQQNYNSNKNKIKYLRLER
jgi:hypothetical protein